MSARNRGPCGKYNAVPPELRGEWVCPNVAKNGYCKFEHVAYCHNPECIAHPEEIFKNHSWEQCTRNGSAKSPSTNPVVVLRETVAQGNPAPSVSACGGFRSQSHLMVGGGGGMGHAYLEELYASNSEIIDIARGKDRAEKDLDKAKRKAGRIGRAEYPRYYTHFVEAIWKMFAENEGRGLQALEMLLGDVPPVELIALDICRGVPPERHGELLANWQVLQEVVITSCENIVKGCYEEVPGVEGDYGPGLESLKKHENG